MAEGIQATRQVAFKQGENTFIERYGESVDEMKFKNVASLNFSSSIKQEIACQ